MVELRQRVEQLEAEVAILISDAWQGRGLGTGLMNRLVEIAKAEGIKRLIADTLPENLEMQRLCERAGFKLERLIDDGVVRAERNLE